jgi:hypothetical protein
MSIRRCLVPKCYQNVAIAAIFAFATSCFGSTVIVVVTPTGIVAGSDGKARTNRCGAAVKFDTTPKVFLLQHRLALSYVGTFADEASDGLKTSEKLKRWAKFIGQQLRSDASVSELENVVINKGASAVSLMAKDPARFACGKKQDSMEYVGRSMIAGYEAGVPIVCSFDVYVDWSKKGPAGVLGGPQVLPKRQSVDARFQPFGYYDVLTKICDAKTESYRQAVSLIPEVREGVCNTDFPRLSINEATYAIRILLQMESKADPDWVGLPFTIVTIPKSGRGRVKRYRRLLPMQSK